MSCREFATSLDRLLTKRRLRIAYAVLAVVYILLGSYLFGLAPFSYAAVPSGVCFPAPELSDEVESVSYRSQLDERKQSLYDVIEEGMRAMSFGVIPGNGFSDDEVSEVFSYVLYDNPDIFWVDYQFKASHNLWGVSFIYLSYLFTDADEVGELYWRHDAIAEEFAAECAVEGLGAEEVADKAVEQICRCSEYSETAELVQNIDSVFDRGETVCAGYSKAYDFLLNRAGIPSIYIVGSTSEEDAGQTYHAWNAYILDGEIVYGDLTWADATSCLDWTKMHQGSDKFFTDHVEYDSSLIDSILGRA